MPEDELKVELTPWGPNQATIDAVLPTVISHPSVRKYLDGTRYRLLSFELVDSEAEPKIRGCLAPSNRYRAMFYDYTNNRMLFADGRLDEPERIEVSESNIQPLPTGEEFNAALEILQRDPEFSSAICEERLRPYSPMPPLINIESELSDGRVERTIAVGLLPNDERLRHEIVGVNMIHESVNRFERGAPEGTLASPQTCGLPNAFQATTPKGTAGQVWITVSQGGTVLWRLLVVRPSASSGTNGSGIELRFVDYRGKRVLYRAHVPILNVKYDPGGCGPYRDWQWQEGFFQANGTDVAPGFRLCPNPAKTILDSGDDNGNFRGVAVYVKGQEVVLVSEMEAGWYRYISEWRLHANGTIRPRFGFSSVTSSCVCTRHHHHVYWRFDFDIRTPGNNVVHEFNNPPIFPPSNWHTKYFEIKRSRDPTRRRKWRVENTVTREGYEIIPGIDDGVATASPDWPFPRGDVWILRYRGSEIDDGVVATGPPYEANLDQFVNGEPIYNQDVVLWYAAHVTHDVTAEPTGSFGHIVGPTLVPVNW